MKKSSKLAKAIARTVLDHPFFATLLLRMRLREDKEIKASARNHLIFIASFPCKIPFDL